MSDFTPNFGLPRRLGNQDRREKAVGQCLEVLNRPNPTRNLSTERRFRDGLTEVRTTVGLPPTALKASIWDRHTREAVDGTDAFSPPAAGGGGGDWILATGDWADTGVWDDSAVWID